MKPFMICHMCTTIDGKILSRRWSRMPGVKNSSSLFETTAASFGIALDRRYDDDEGVLPQTVRTEPGCRWSGTVYVATQTANRFAIGVDVRSETHWKSGEVDGDHVVLLLTDRVSDDYLAHLKSAGVSYLFCGKREVDLSVALDKLARKFKLKKAMVQGGGKMNGSFLHAGLIDEISQVIVPVADGGQGVSVFVDIPGKTPKKAAAHLKRKSVKLMNGGVIWVKYQVAAQFGKFPTKEFLMNYTSLGKTGLKVSRICLGCMSYGVPERGPHPWSLDEDKSGRSSSGRSKPASISSTPPTSIPTARARRSSAGRCEIRQARRDRARDQGARPDARPSRTAAGLSRKAILTEIDASLRRLGTDYVDLYQIHRWDYETPIEETLEALHDVVKAGKARYIGASSMYAWQFCKALYLADAQRLDAVRLDAEPLQPALSRGRARDDAAVRRSRGSA